MRIASKMTRESRMMKLASDAFGLDDGAYQQDERGKDGI